jgi:hypothetical protein
MGGDGYRGRHSGGYAVELAQCSGCRPTFAGKHRGATLRSNVTSNRSQHMAGRLKHDTMRRMHNAAEWGDRGVGILPG